MIPGDGIGKEVTAEAVKLLEAIGNVDLHHLPWGADHYLATGETIPSDGYDTLRSFEAILVGAGPDGRAPHRGRGASAPPPPTYPTLEARPATPPRRERLISRPSRPGSNPLWYLPTKNFGDTMTSFSTEIAAKDAGALTVIVVIFLAAQLSIVGGGSGLAVSIATWTSPRWPDTRVMRPSWTVTG